MWLVRIASGVVWQVAIVAFVAGVLAVSGHLAYGAGHDIVEGMEPFPAATLPTYDPGAYPTPAQQLRDGVPVSMVQCNDPLSLYLRNPPPIDAILEGMLLEDVGMDRYEKGSEGSVEGVEVIAAGELPIMGGQTAGMSGLIGAAAGTGDEYVVGGSGIFATEMDEPGIDLGSAAPICISEESALILAGRGLNIISFSDLSGAVSAAEADLIDMHQQLRAVIDEAIAAYGEGGFDAITQDPGVENYVFVLDRDGTRVARGVDLTPAEANAGQIEWTPSQDKINAMLAEEGDEAWVVYQFPSHTTGELEPKRSLVVLHDGYLFASGYAIAHEEYSNELLRYAISDAIALYEENDRDVTSLTRNSTSTSYAFVVDPHELVILAHEQNSLYVGFDVSNVPTTPSTEYLVDTLLSQPEPDALYDPENPDGEIWIVWEFDNPLTGNYDYRHGLVVLHDGLVFVSSHELDEEVYREVAAECTTSCIVGTQV